MAQEEWKATSSSIPEPARQKGTCFVDGHPDRKEAGPFPICIPIEYADHNLLRDIRQEAIGRFADHGIEWHMWTPAPNGGRWPSSHLLDSQVQCVNVLLSLSRNPDLLLMFARRAVPDAVSVAVVEDGSPVAFEWIGMDDYLGEGRGRARQRGRFVTSADALVVAERADGGRTGIVVEWKFTETYLEPVPFRGTGGTDRRGVYRDAYHGDGSPFFEKPDIGAFFQEPHYQLLRLALLASGMVKDGELGMDRAVLAHLVPAGNEELHRTVPQGLHAYGDDIAKVWGRLLPGPVVRYACIDSMSLFTATPDLGERYGSLAQTQRMGPSP
jgi:hypothetical protein